MLGVAIWIPQKKLLPQKTAVPKKKIKKRGKKKWN
jgi:hypothetical protein